MSEMTAMDNEMPETLRNASRDEEAVAQGLIANKAEQQTPGEMLREARIGHGYSVADLCAQTMLSKHTVEALEDNRFEDLSQPVFARGYYRKCGKVLDMDADALMAAYASSGGARRAATPAPIVGVNVVPADVTPDRRRTFGAFFLILILLIAAFAAYLFWSERNSTRTTADNDGSGITLTAPFDGQDAEPANAGDEGKPVMSPLSGPLGNGAGDAATDATPDTAARMATDDTALPVDDSNTQAATAPAADDESSDEGTAAVNDDASDDTAEATAGDAVAATALTLQFNERSWVSVHDASGKQLLVGIYEDTSRTLDGQPPYKLVIGYGPGVDVRLGDKTIDFKVADNQTARFSVGNNSQ